MKKIAAMMGAFLIIALTAALDQPWDNGIYFTTGLLALWMVIRLWSDKPIYIPWLVFAIALYVILQAILLIKAPHTPLAIHWVGSNLMFILLLILSLDIIKNWHLSRILEDALIILLFAACVGSLVEIFLWYLQWWGIYETLFPLPLISPPRPNSFLSHPVSLAGFINIVWPIVFVRLYISQDTKRKIIMGGLLSLCLAVMYFTASRAGWLIAIIEIGAILSLLYLPSIIDRFNRRKMAILANISRAGIFRAGLVILIVVSFSYVMLVARTRSTGRAPTTLTYRLEIWGIAKELITSSPITGHGPGSFPANYASLMKKWPGALPSLPHANNLFLQVGAEEGFLGIALMVLIFWIAVRSFVKAWKSAPDFDSRLQLSAYAGIGLSIAVHNQVEFLFNYGHNSLYTVCVIIFVALVLNFAPKSEFLALSKKQIYPFVIGVLGIYGFLIFNLQIGRDAYLDGLDAARNGNWAVARDLICGAIEKDTDNALYYFHCSIATANLAYQDNNLEALDEAIYFQEQGLEIDPALPTNWGNLAVLQWEKGEYTEAYNNIRHASTIYHSEGRFRNYIIDFNLGWMAEQLGNTQEALDAYTKALQRDPWLKDSMYNEASPVFQTALNNLSERYKGFVWSGWNALKTGNLEVAYNELNFAVQSSPTNTMAYALLALVYQRMGNLEEASENIQIALFLSRSPRVLAIAGHIARLNGQESEAAKYLLQIVEDMQQNPDTWRYYYFVYRQGNTLVYSPYIRYGFLNPEMEEDFTWLADYLEQNGEVEKHRRVINWVERNTPP